LSELEHKLEKLEADMTSGDRPTHLLAMEASSLGGAASRLEKEMSTEHQPTKRLFDAILTLQRLSENKTRTAISLEDGVENLSGVPKGLSFSPPRYDQVITLHAHLIQLKAQEMHIRKRIEAFKRGRTMGMDCRLFTPVAPIDDAVSFLERCDDLIRQASNANLPRIVISATLVYSRVSYWESWYRRTHHARGPKVDEGEKSSNPAGDLADYGTEQKKTTRERLDDALALCKMLPDSEALRAAVEAAVRLFEGPRYEEITASELAAVKAAMVSGPSGIATHSGHWYNCVNGHPVSAFSFPLISHMSSKKTVNPILTFHLHSSPLANAACLWNLPVALSAELRLAASTTPLLQVFLGQLRWSKTSRRSDILLVEGTWNCSRQDSVVYACG